MDMENKNFLVMLIDDNEIDNEINAKLLQKKAGIEHIVVRQSGQNALNYLKEVSNSRESIPDMILLDIHMPEMDGFDFLDSFKKLPGPILEKSRIFMLTSSRDASDLNKAKNDPKVEDILTKPFNVNHIFN